MESAKESVFFSEEHFFVAEVICDKPSEPADALDPECAEGGRDFGVVPSLVAHFDGVAVVAEFHGDFKVFGEIFFVKPFDLAKDVGAKHAEHAMGCVQGAEDRHEISHEGGKNVFDALDFFSGSVCLL